MSTQELDLDAIYDLAKKVMLANGCDVANAEALADIISRAERDGSHSHGLFRVPGYVKALRSGKVDGKAKPTIKHVTPAVIQVDGRGCFAPLAQSVGLPVLVEATNQIGIGALSLATTATAARSGRSPSPVSARPSSSAARTSAPAGLAERPRAGGSVRRDMAARRAAAAATAGRIREAQICKTTVLPGILGFEAD